MRHRLSGLSTYRLNGLDREMSTPPTLRRGTAALPLPRKLTHLSTGPPLPAVLCGMQISTLHHWSICHTIYCLPQTDVKLTVFALVIVIL